MMLDHSRYEVFTAGRKAMRLGCDGDIYAELSSQTK
jgi:hypothetical protein